MFLGLSESCALEWKISAKEATTEEVLGLYGDGASVLLGR